MIQLQHVVQLHAEVDFTLYARHAFSGSNCAARVASSSGLPPAASDCCK